MNIQSLSVVVPNNACINNCKFCCAKMHDECYPNAFKVDEGRAWKEFNRRMAFARDNGCNTVMLTGNTEPQVNWSFLQRFGRENIMLEAPFRWIEIQTTGVMLDEGYLDFLRDKVGVNVISLSISSFDDEVNHSIIQSPHAQDDKFLLKPLCKMIKDMGFTLRLSLNLNKWFEQCFFPSQIFEYAKSVYNADQVTCRVLYADGNSPQAEWVRNNAVNNSFVKSIEDYIKSCRKLERLPHGLQKYDVMGMSVIIDADSMAQEDSDSYKYLILREDCKLYSKWDTPASLIF